MMPPMSMYCCTNARTASLVAISLIGASMSRFCEASHERVISASSSMSAAMNGRPSPMTTAWATIGHVLMTSSIGAGLMFLPPAVMMMSFLRPVMNTNPRSSIVARSPVCSQPSEVRASAVR